LRIGADQGCGAGQACAPDRRAHLQKRHSAPADPPCRQRPQAAPVQHQKYTFQRLLGDSENIAPNLVDYINGFSATAPRVFEKFKFSDQIEKLDSSNRLYAIIQAMAGIDLHPDRIDNIQMGYLFEHLIMRFNEQANEGAGDHFTPREVIRLMTHLVYTGDEDVYKPGVYREMFDLD
jgi:type I restriction enzyme M protein